jgi:hypothetical protein
MKEILILMTTRVDFDIQQSILFYRQPNDDPEIAPKKAVLKTTMTALGKLWLITTFACVFDDPPDFAAFGEQVILSYMFKLVLLPVHMYFQQHYYFVGLTWIPPVWLP